MAIAFDPVSNVLVSDSLLDWITCAVICTDCVTLYKQYRNEKYLPDGCFSHVAFSVLCWTFYWRNGAFFRGLLHFTALLFYSKKDVHIVACVGVFCIVCVPFWSILGEVMSKCSYFFAGMAVIFFTHRFARERTITIGLNLLLFTLQVKSAVGLNMTCAFVFFPAGIGVGIEIYKEMHGM